MSVGCLAAPRKANLLKLVPPLSLVAVFCAAALLMLYKMDLSLAVNVGNQASPQLVYFGTEARSADPTNTVIPMEVIAGFFFVLVALIFVGIGQVMGRRFDMITNRVFAYTTNVCGSLAGIVVFAIVSLLWLPPAVWFAISFACVGYFLIRQSNWRAGGGRRRLALAANICCFVVTVIGVGLAGSGDGTRLIARLLPKEKRSSLMDRDFYWSPYYWIEYNVSNGLISTNNIGHQQMLAVGTRGLAYSVPYMLSKSAQRPPIKDVLVIGAGSGNDVATALAFGAEHVDAVEIDPVIYDIGKHFHPNKPYDDPRVHIHLNDGRNFLKEGTQQYDLIVYALVDSLILHSGYSSIRLENYLFTRQAMADVKARLKNGGMFVMYNFFRQGWLVGRLRHMTAEVFGSEPILIALPYQAEIAAAALPGDAPCFTMIMVGDTQALKQKFSEEKAYWMPLKNFLANPDMTSFSPTPPAAAEPNEVILRIGPATVAPSDAAQILPADNWPFLYLKGYLLPDVTILGMVMIAAASVVLLALFVPHKKIRFNWTMFFLGAGFMLLETKGVVHLALLFGSTWIVNSIVFFAILVMILLANLYVLRARPRNMAFFYVALIIALVVNIFFSLDKFLGLPELVRIAGSCLIVFAPIFFAGVIFTSFFRESANPDMDMGSNIAGVVLGGLAENFSMVLGFNHLLWIAIGFYLLSRLLKGRYFPRPRLDI